MSAPTAALSPGATSSTCRASPSDHFGTAPRTKAGRLHARRARHSVHVDRQGRRQARQSPRALRRRDHTQRSELCRGNGPRHDRTMGPMPFDEDERMPVTWYADVHADMTGGMGFDGLGHLKAFVDAGGLMSTFREASDPPARRASCGDVHPSSLGTLLHPGSVVRVKARRPGHPILYGYPETFNIFRGNGSLFSTSRRDRGTMVLEYGTCPARDEEEPKDSGPMLGLPTPSIGTRCERRARGTGRDRPARVVWDGAERRSDHRPGGGDRRASGSRTRHRLHLQSPGPVRNEQDFALAWNALTNRNDLPAKPVPSVR